MAIPKSVTRVNKKGLKYVSDVDKVEYYLFELSRAALRDVSKFVSISFKNKYYQNFKRSTGNAGKATKYTVYSNKKTKYPRTEIGLKTGKVDGFYAYFQEFGTSKQPKLGLLRKTVNENISKIVEIESKYLSGLDSEAKVRKLINEKVYEGDGNG